MKIEYIADHLHHAPELSALLYEEFDYLIPHRALKEFEERMLAHCNKEAFPLACITRKNGKLLGTFSLRVADLETHTQFTPWIGSVYVHPSRRREGIGNAPRPKVAIPLQGTRLSRSPSINT